MKIFPAIDITRSGTRREELLFDKNDLQKMNVLRRIIAPMGTMDAIEFISSKLKDTKNKLHGRENSLHTMPGTILRCSLK